MEVKYSRNAVALVLGALIIFGLFIRFAGLGDGLILRDEGINIIAAIKLHSPNPYDARLYASDHPPVSKWILGIPTIFLNFDRGLIAAIGPHMFVYTYLAPFREVVVPMRFISAVAGVVLIVLFFLLTRELFGKEAAWWSTAVAALSLDYLTYSQNLIPEIFPIAFSTATIYLFVKYIKTEERVYLYALTIVHALALGSRLLYPQLLPIILVITTLLLKKPLMKRGLLIASVIISLYLFFFHLYPPEVRDFAFQIRYGSYGELARFFPGFLSLIPFIFARHSYAFLFGLLLFCASGMLFFRKNLHKATSLSRVVSWLRSLNERLVLLVSFAVAFLFYGITLYGTNVSYVQLIFIPLIPLVGFMFVQKKNRYIKPIALVLLLVNVVSIFSFRPYYAQYANFPCQECPISWFKENLHDPVFVEAEVISSVDQLTTNQFLTNIQSLLYASENAIPILPEGHPDCNDQFLSQLREAQTIIAYRGFHMGATSIYEDKFICQKLKQLQLAELKVFRVREDDTKPLILYRVSG